MSDWVHAKSKLQSGKDWRGTANVPIGDDTFELSFRLLSEDEMQQEILPRVNIGAIAQHKAEADDDDVEARVEELQDKDELSEEEEAELKELNVELLQNKSGLMDELGKETFAAIQDAGMYAIVPDDEDIEQVVSATPTELRERFEDIDGVTVPQSGSYTRADAERWLTQEMKQVLTNNPYMVKYTIGMKAFMESYTAGGNSNGENDVALST